MYVFVLEWTPALTIKQDIDKSDASNPPIPHGFIFAAYMVILTLNRSKNNLISIAWTINRLLLWSVPIYLKYYPNIKKLKNLWGI